MKIYHRYLVSLWFANFLLTFCVINSLLLIGNLVRYKNLGWFNLIPILPALIPAMLIYSLPLSSLMATLFSLSKVRQTIEPITLASSGVSIQQWSKPLILIGFLLSVVTLISLEWLQPWGESYKRNYLNHISSNMIKQQLKLTQTELPIGHEHLHLYKNNEGLTSAIIQQKQNQKLNREIFLTSTKIEVDEDKQQLILDPIGPVHIFNFSEGKFGHGIVTEMEPQILSYPRKFKSSQSFKRLPLSEMFSLIQKGDHKEQAKLQSYFHEKLCFTFAPFLLVLIAIPIGFMGKSTDHSRCFILGLLLSFIIYFPALFVVKEATKEGVPYTGFVMQIPNLILIALTIFGMRRLNARI